MTKSKTKRIERFIDNYESEITINTYGSVLKNYFNLFQSEETLEEKATAYFQAERDYEEDLNDFFNSELKTKSPKTRRLYLSVMKKFFRKSPEKIKFDQDVFDDFNTRIGNTDAITIDRLPTKDEAKVILNFLPTKARAFFLALFSSGARIGEMSKVKVDDIEFDRNPVRINLRRSYTKGKKARTIFISDEASEAIQGWLIHRKQHTEDYNLVESNRVFPGKSQDYRRSFVQAIEKAKLGDKCV